METPKTFGSAEWADAQHLVERNMFQTEKGQLLGTALDGVEWDKIPMTRIVICSLMRPRRSGKGVSHIVPNLLEYDGSVLVIDPKGENAMLLADALVQKSKKGDPFWQEEANPHCKASSCS